jgi:hypothetical protein
MDEREESMADKLTKLETTVERMQAELEWVKVVLSGKKPEDTAAKTSPPWLATASLLIVPIVTAIIATKPWA